MEKDSTEHKTEAMYINQETPASNQQIKICLSRKFSMRVFLGHLQVLTCNLYHAEINLQ